MSTETDLFTTARATLLYRGVPVELDLFTLDADTLAQVEKRIARLLDRPEWSAPSSAQAQAPQQAPQRRPKVAPAYDDQGYACCPTHGRRLSEGQYGFYCSSKAQGDEPADKRGYCGLKFEV